MTLVHRYLSGIGPGAVAYERVAQDTATGASPLTVSTTGVADGDVCVWALQATNSVPDINGPEGGGWTELWRIDLSGNEWATAWFKFADGAEPSTWEWTHSSGSAVSSAMGIWRGPSRFVTKNFQETEHWFPGAVPGSYGGLLVGCATFNASTTPAMTRPVALTEATISNTYAGLIDSPVTDPVRTDLMLIDTNAVSDVLLGVVVFE